MIWLYILIFLLIIVVAMYVFRREDAMKIKDMITGLFCQTPTTPTNTAVKPADEPIVKPNIEPVIEPDITPAVRNPFAAT